MKFPLSKINISNHKKLICNLLKDDETIIFLDTNIIALIYCMNKKAREEFFNWLKPLITKNRIKIPNWVISEYTSRFTKDKINDYLSPLKLIITIQKEFEQLFKFLNVHIDETTLYSDPKKKYDNIEDLKFDLNHVREILGKIKFLSDTKKADFTHDLHSEIENLLHECILDTDIDNILKDIEQTAQIRYNHRFPPGFADSSKNTNQYGDLIIWKEILNYCKKEQCKKVIFLTNDEKEDWVYAPIKIETNRIINNSDKYKIIDPRLVHEFYLATGSEQIEILSFQQLIMILIKEFPVDFFEVSIALQFEDETKKRNDESTDIISEIELVKNDDNSDLESNNNIKDIHLEPTALRDKYFELSSKKDFLTNIIIDLKSYNWYKQNSAVENFINNISNLQYDRTTQEQSKLFVIGRNLYQAACGGSASAHDLIKNNLITFTQDNTHYLINLIIAGMIYEIYFDSNGKFRLQKLKSQFLNELLNSIEDNPRLDHAQKFIKNQLEQHSAEVIYIPFSDNTVEMNVVFNNELRITKDWQGNEVKYNELQSIEYKLKELLTDNSDNAFTTHQSEFTELGLEMYICACYGIPKKRLKLELINYNHDLRIIFGDKYLKKWN